LQAYDVRAMPTGVDTFIKARDYASKPGSRIPTKAQLEHILANKAGKSSYAISDFDVEWEYNFKTNLKYNFRASLTDRGTVYVGTLSDYTTQ
jgi:hypothetical protein